MLIAQHKKTTIAWAPNVLCDAINKYSVHESIMITSRKHLKCDILHAHNKIVGSGIQSKKTIVQYHSEPFQVDLTTRVDARLVIAQYHATLPQYANCNIVRNILDFNTASYNPIIVDNKIRIGFSPSRIKKLGQWHDKGYDKTAAILNKLNTKYSNVEIDIIRNVPLAECILRKSKCNILIDECVTKSYHRSGLEGLALGKYTICSVGGDVAGILKKASGSATNPFINVWINDLEKHLTGLIEAGDVNHILEVGKDSRAWMEQHWNPETIVGEFIKIYEKVLSS